MPKPLLPLLIQEHDVEDINNAGTWEQRTATELENISRGLDVTTPNPDRSAVNSIPNMWARPLLFEMALYNSHPLHGHILGEWRGLLAMLAFKERYNFPVTTEEIRIPDDNQGVPEFLRALRCLLPIDTLALGTTWDGHHLILYDENPIGLTSPTTLVCTSVNYAGNVSDVPWSNEGSYLCDPIDFLTQEEKAAFVGWLNNIFRQFDPAAIDGLNTNLSDSLRGLITRFIGDLSIAGTEFKFSERRLGFTGIFSCIDRPILGREYFTEKLFVIKQKDAFNGSPQISIDGDDSLVDLNGLPVTPILPIKENLLVDPAIRNSLQQRVTFKQIDNGIRVSLRLPAAGADAQNNELVTYREYKYVDKEAGPDYLRENREIVEIPTVPVLEIWPNFKAENWKIYYTYCKVSQDTFYAKPFLPAGTEDDDSQLFLESAGDDNDKITKTSYFPEVMLCKYKTPGSARDEDAGVLITSVPNVLSPDESTWTVGVDFGTTSTAVYRNDGHNPPSPITFDARLLQVTDSDDSDRVSLYDYFFPSASQQTPFFSLLHIWNSNQDARQQLEPLLNGHIYFLSDYQRFNDENTKGRIYSDLKWSSDPADRRRAQVFFRQLCLQCAAEAVAVGATGIKWRFSFPMAFSRRDQTDFGGIWSNVTNACTQVTGLNNEGIESEPESIVIAKYFAHSTFPGTFAPGAVCIDIGGATSDISIWKNNELCSQTSLRFAGRNIFLDLLAATPKFLRHFGVDDQVTNKLEGVIGNNLGCYPQIDALLENEYQDWLELFLLTKGEFPVNQFEQLVAIGIAGLLYYIGLLLNYLIEVEEFESDYICIYIGGKGSRILDWFGNKEFDMELLQQVFHDASGFNGRVEIQITEAPKGEAAFGLVSSETELVVARNNHQNEEENHQGLIVAGESFTIDEDHYEWTEVLTPEMFDNDLIPEDTLEQIQKFVESFNRNAGPGNRNVLQIPIEMTEGDRTDNISLKAGIADPLKRIQAIDAIERRSEPLFILLLKDLLKKKTAEWKEKI